LRWRQWRAKNNLTNSFLTCFALGAELSAGHDWTTNNVITIHHAYDPICGLFFRSRKGYKLPLLKGRYYG
jgi:hypothetical protein